jgi:hypothetical protein
VGGDDQPDGRGRNPQTIAHQIQYRGNDTSGHNGQGGGSQDYTQGEIFGNSHNP